MQMSARGVLAAVVAGASTLALAIPAAAADHPAPTPSQSQVTAAKKKAEAKAADVAALQADLAVANATLAGAARKAEIAAETYNGAMWRLQVATRASTE